MARTFALIIVALTLATWPGKGQTPPADSKQQQLAALVKEVRGQQAAIAENQKKIETKLAAVAESIRLARIYAGRGGK
jgi:hypothetical protein